jgi:hypothetical protein
MAFNKSIQQQENYLQRLRHTQRLYAMVAYRKNVCFWQQEGNKASTRTAARADYSIRFEMIHWTQMPATDLQYLTNHPTTDRLSERLI